MTRLNFFRNAFIMIGILIISSSCEDEFKSFATVNYVPCDDSTVTVDPNTITDFECQTNSTIGTVEVVRNPAETPLNTSKFVGMFTDTPGATDNIEIDYGTPIDLSTNTVFKIKVKTEIAGKLRVELTGGTSETVYIQQDIAGDNGWAIYNFDFSCRQGGNYTKVLLYFNYGVAVIGGTTNVYHIDDLLFDVYVDPCQNIPKDLTILNDFKCQQNYTLLNGTVEVTPISSPYPTNVDDNSCDFVGLYTDDGTNGSDALSIDLGSAFDLTDNPHLHIKVYASMTAPLRARLEGGAKPTDVTSQITTTGEWVNYIFRFDTAGNDHTKLLIYFNDGQTSGTASDIYYINDLKFLPAPCEDPLVEDCTGVIADKNIISDWNCQQNFGIETRIPIVSTPLVDCENRSEKVGEYTDNGTSAWDNIEIGYGTVIDLSTHNKLKFKFYSPDKSVQVLAKLQGGSAIEKWSDFSAVGTWQEFTYNFDDAITNNNTTLVLFFNGGQTNGTTKDIYYIDELRWEE